MTKTAKWILGGVIVVGGYIVLQRAGLLPSFPGGGSAPGTNGAVTYAAYKAAWTAARNASRPNFYLRGPMRNIAPRGQGQYIYRYATATGEFVSAGAWWTGDPQPE